MDKLLKSIRIIFNVIGGLFCFASVVLMIVLLIINKGNNDFYDAAVVVPGKVEVMSYNDSGTVIEYYVNGTKYDKHFNCNNSSLYPGKEVNVYYNQSNPEDSRIKEFTIIPSIVLGILSGVFFFIGLFTIIIINIICHIINKKHLLSKKEVNHYSV